MLNLDNKVMELYTKRKLLETKLNESQLEEEKLKLALEVSNKAVKDSKDEIVSIQKSYEQQHQVLTEHLIILNEKISKFEMELTNLKSHKVKCAKCSAWNTLEWITTEGRFGQKCCRGNHTIINFSV
eukprot:TRINITY_DN961_c0_g2_i4.p1 TRINITY_DN961_c0_g2~~TRINITY_DN961_c0_g2_i4.p1  ORF type:complete len:127 (-),score=14.95 TRINITY_DN961_c0_g2_i4:35-415(-)